MHAAARQQRRTRQGRHARRWTLLACARPARMNATHVYARAPHRQKTPESPTSCAGNESPPLPAVLQIRDCIVARDVRTGVQDVTMHALPVPLKAAPSFSSWTSCFHALPIPSGIIVNSPSPSSSTHSTTYRDVHGLLAFLAALSVCKLNASRAGLSHRTPCTRTDEGRRVQGKTAILRLCYTGITSVSMWCCSGSCFRATGCTTPLVGCHACHSRPRSPTPPGTQTPLVPTTPCTGVMTLRRWANVLGGGDSVRRGHCSHRGDCGATRETVQGRPVSGPLGR